MGKKYQVGGYTAGWQKPTTKKGQGADRLGHCSAHDKTTWATRKAARREAHNRHPESRKTPYRCPATGGWHYGSLNMSRESYRGLREDDEGTDDGLA